MKMTVLEKTQKILKEYEVTSKDQLDTYSAIKYMMIYYQEALIVLLEIELSDTENNEEYIKNIIKLSFIKHCKKLVDELTEKHTSSNIVKINKLLKTTTLSIDEINNQP